MTGLEMIRLLDSGRTVADVARAAGVEYATAWAAIRRARAIATGDIPTFVCDKCRREFIVGEGDNCQSHRYRHSLRNRIGGKSLCDECARGRFRRMLRSPLRAGSPCFIVEHDRPPWMRAVPAAGLLLLVLLAVPARSRAELAGSAVRAVAILASAREAGVVAPSDARAVQSWVTQPGRFPDEAAVAAYLAPSAPMPEGEALPPRLRLLGDDARLTAFVRALPGVAPGVTVRTVPRGPTRFDQPARVIYLAEDADLPALLHEAGHAAVGSDSAATYERTFRDFRGALRPEDTALFQDEREADAAYSADLLSAARATRSYWRGIRDAILSAD